MIHKFRSWIDKKQFCPIIEDIENKELNTIAKRLKGDSEKETLTNILDWQDRNIQYWWERGPFDLSLKFLGPISWMMVLTIVYPFLQLLHLNNLTYFFIFVITVLIFISMLYINLFLIFYLFLFFPLIYLLTNIALRIPILAQSIFPYTLFYIGCLGAFTIIIVHFLYRYKKFYREKILKEKISKFIEVVNYTFRLRLPVDKILEYKLAICRDYAELTASLLFNICHDSEVYFFRIPWHVAAGIKINGKYYILDQQLPVLTMDKWLARWNEKDADVYVSDLLRNSEGKLIDVHFKYHEKVSLFSENFVNTGKLTEEVAEMLKVRQISQKEKPDFETSLKNCAIYYEDDDITKYSLMKAIKNKLENEFCGNVDKISKIDINQSENKNDLNLSVYLQQ